MAGSRLPILKSELQELGMMQTQWASVLNPIVANPSLNSIILKNIALIAGANSVPHKLGRKLQGWRLIRLRAAASVHDTQDSNQMPQLTLDLVSSAPVTVDIEVF